MMPGPKFDRDRFKTWIDLATKASTRLTSDDPEEQKLIAGLQGALILAQALADVILYK